MISFYVHTALYYTFIAKTASVLVAHVMCTSQYVLHFTVKHTVLSRFINVLLWQKCEGVDADVTYKV